MPRPVTPPVRVHAATPPPEHRPTLHRFSSSVSSFSLSPPPNPHTPPPTFSPPLSAALQRQYSSPGTRTGTGTGSPDTPGGPGMPGSEAGTDYWAAQTHRGRERSRSSPRPPSYARSRLDRSPSSNPMQMDDRPRVPPPIYLRSSSPQGVSSKGSLKIHVPAWGVALVRPPRPLDLHPLEAGQEPPIEDTVLSGALEVTVKERVRCQAISVGVQSVCRLHMGVEREWEEDGVFERGVEVLGGDAEGIWLEPGSQTFTFSILLPATLATHDHHAFGRISYILTARVEGIPAPSSFSSIFRRPPEPIASDIPFKQDFDSVIARSDKLAQELALSRSHSRDSIVSGMNSLGLGLSGTGTGLGTSPPDDSAIAISIGEGSPSVTGLYHRRQSSDVQMSPGTRPLLLAESDRRSVMSDSGVRTEKTGWMKGDLLASRSLIVHANPSQTGGVNTLDLRKEGFVEGLGSWRFAAQTDVFSISSVLLLSITCPSPGPKTTIFFCRLLLSQAYVIHSPRTPNSPPHRPEAPKNHVLYQVGRAHKSGERFPARSVDSLWRGTEAGGCGGEEGWKVRAMARMPNHDRIRPSTNSGTITPIRVSHEFLLQIFYSLDGESVTGAVVDGPGELRMMAVKIGVLVPSCCCSGSALNLPTYERAPDVAPKDIDAVLASPPSKQQCMCGSTFAELGEAAMRRMQLAEQEDMEERLRAQAGSPEKACEAAAESGRGSPSGGSGVAARDDPHAALADSGRRSKGTREIGFAELSRKQ